LLNFILNIFYFTLGFLIPLSLDIVNYLDDKKMIKVSLLLITLLISGLFLFLNGPNIIFFGLFLSSGWKLLNFSLDYFI